MLDVRYLAGLFDGEGNVGMVPKESGFYLRVGISNTHKGVLDEIMDQFGGKINTRKPKGKCKECHQWVATYGPALRFLEAVKPHLVIKKKQAELGLEWKKYRLGPGAWKGEIADAARAEILRIRQEIIELNSWTGNKALKVRDFHCHPATEKTRNGWRRGRYIGGRKLNENEAIEILHLKGSIKRKSVAERYSVSEALVACIWNGSRWKHLHRYSL